MTWPPVLTAPYAYGPGSKVTGFAHVPPAAPGGEGFGWVMALLDYAEPDIPMRWPDPAPDVWTGPDAPLPAAPLPERWGFDQSPRVCLGTDMDCGRPLPCPDHPEHP